MASGTISQTNTVNSNALTRIIWSSTSNTTANTSSVTATVQAQYTGSVYGMGTFSGSLVINGTSRNVSEYRTWYPNVWNDVGSNTITVPHNDNGSKSITISGTLVQTGTTMAGTYYQSGTATLDTIPRASSLTARSVNIGQSNTITWSRASTSFTHTLSYSFQGLTGTIGTGLSTSSTWTPPDTFYAKIPSSTSATGTLTLTTYNGTTVVGSSTATLTANTVENICRPSVSGVISDSNSTTVALTGNSSKIVRYQSNMLVTPTIVANKSSSISKKYINSAEFTTNTVTITNPSVSYVTLSATDTRGYSTSATSGSSSNLISYNKISINGEVSRNSSTGNLMYLSFGGTYWNESFGIVNNQLTLTLRVKTSSSSTYTNGQTLTYEMSDEKFSSGSTAGVEELIQITNPLSSDGLWDYETAYTIQVVASDKLTNDTLTYDVTVGKPVLNVYKKDDEQYCNVNGILTVNDEKIFAYEVGEVIITSTNVNPSNIRGGSWELIDKGFTSKTATITPPINTTNTTSCVAGCVWRDGSIRIRLTVVNKIAIADATVAFATLTPNLFGLNDWQWNVYPVGCSDGGNTTVMGGLNDESYVFQSYDAYNGLSAGQTTYYQIHYQGVFSQMLDSWCDKFYWKKTA